MPAGELFREMVNGLPLIVWVHDERGEQIMVNDMFCEFFGVTRAEMRENHWQALMHPADAEAYLSSFFASIRERRLFHAEVRVRRADGQWRWLESWARPRYSESGEYRGLVGTSADITERKNAEEGLDRAYQQIARQHAHLQAVYDAMDDGLIAFDVRGRPVVVNKAFERLFGPFEAGGSGRELGDFQALFEVAALDGTPVPFEDWPVSRVLRGERVSHVELRTRRRDTGQSWVISYGGEPAHDRDGNQILAVVVTRDVTEQGLRLRQLRESEERAQAIITSITDGLITTDSDWIVVLANPRAERLLGPLTAHGGLVGRSLWDTFRDVEDTRFEHCHRRAMAERLPVAFEFHYAPLDRWFDARACPVPGGGISTYFLDITERKRTEEALRESEQRFRTLADNMSQLAWMADPQGAIFWYNRRWYEFTGTTLGQVRGWGWTQLHHPDHVDRVMERMRHSWAMGAPWEDLFPLRGKDGSYRWFLSRACPVRDANGSIVRWFGTNTDVTDQREAEERLRESDRRKDEYLAMLGHELRNPLAAIQSATEVLRLASTQDPRVLRAAAVLGRQSEHMVRLVDGLLEVSRIARGKIELHRLNLELGSICQHVLGDRGSLLAAQGLELTLEIPTSPVWVYADHVRLAQILDNLLGNAVKFTPPPGHVSVTLRTEGDFAILTVRDSGVGIRGDVLERIFDPFHQETQDVARNGGGLGLGLAMSRGLAELHGGTIEARSEGLGAGSEFVVRLPLGSAAPAAPRVERQETPSTHRILIVEDNTDTAQMFSEVLRCLGHEVTVTQAAQEALTTLRSGPQDVVLCDIGLPGMSGYDFALAVRADPKLQGIPLIALTGYGQPEDRRRSADAGFDAHLTKPVDLAQLRTVLRESSRRQGNGHTRVGAAQSEQEKSEQEKSPSGHDEGASPFQRG